MRRLMSQVCDPLLMTESPVDWGPEAGFGVPPVEARLPESQVILGPLQHSWCPEGIVKRMLASRA